MRVTKRNMLSFNNIIYILVVSFVVHQLLSLYNLNNVIYPSTNITGPIIKVLSSLLFIAFIIVFIYYLPILIVIEIYSFYINLSVRFNSKSRFFRKVKIFIEKYVENNLIQKLQRIRC